MMDEDGEDKDISKRKNRNLGEKMRRDQFNMLVAELSKLLDDDNRKMDKTSVLKSAITFLKNHKEVTKHTSRPDDIHEEWKPAFLSNDEFIHLVLEAVEGFVMVFSADGKIYYVSENISSLLGHNSVDLVNKNIFDLTFEEDRANFYNLLQTNASSKEQMSNACKENELIKFNLHLRRGSMDSKEEVYYDLVQFYGNCRINKEFVDEEGFVENGDAHSRTIFLCIGRLYTPQLLCEAMLVESNQNEFTSRHSMEWKYLFLDHRAPPIIGYMPFEVLGTSGYDYYHFDDLEKVVSCHEALIQKGKMKSCCYRFLTKGQQWIWLHTRFYITYHQWNSKPEYVVCKHRVVSYSDVMKARGNKVVQDTDANEAEASQSSNLQETRTVHTLQPFVKPYQSDSQDTRDRPDYFHLPSFRSEAVTDCFGNSYQLVSQPASVCSTAGTVATAASVIAEGAIWQRSNTRYTGGSETSSPYEESRPSQRISKQETASVCCAASDTADTAGASRQRANTRYAAGGLDTGSLFEESRSSQPASVCSASDSDTATADTAATAAAACASWQRANSRYTGRLDNVPLFEMPRPCQRINMQEPASVCSASDSDTAGTVATADTAGASRQRANTHYAGGFDTGSHFEESRSSQRIRMQEKPCEPMSFDAQLVSGGHYMKRSGCVGAEVPLSTLPMNVDPDHAQTERPWQRQLQWKQDQLQNMIERQQDQLQQMKEQLLFAKLGILQPLINVPGSYTTLEELRNQQRLTAQLAYTNPPLRAMAPGFPPGSSLPALLALPPLSPRLSRPSRTSHPARPARTSNPPPPPPPHPPHPTPPTHPSDPHQHMPQ